jgi:aryl-alcohol dehydrogenase-like predicted oxidoreductase
MSVHPVIRLPRICLGSAQFGGAYGISNRRGWLHERDIKAILESVIELGIGYIDTAPSYGDAEVFIGRYLPRDHNVRIVTKISPIADSTISLTHSNAVIAAIENSLRRMRIDRAYAVLVHHAADISKPGAERLVAALMAARQRGLAEKIGVSIYDAAQLSQVKQHTRVDLVQLPLNVLDPRLVFGGYVKELKAEGIEVHARSVFLQGLLLMKPRDLPDYFAPIRQILAGLEESWRCQGMSALQACLAFAVQQDGVDAVVVGVNHQSELHEVHRAVSSLEGSPQQVSFAYQVDPMYLNPTCWPSFPVEGPVNA